METIPLKRKILAWLQALSTFPTAYSLTRHAYHLMRRPTAVLSHSIRREHGDARAIIRSFVTESDGFSKVETASGASFLYRPGELRASQELFQAADLTASNICIPKDKNMSGVKKAFSRRII